MKIFIALAIDTAVVKQVNWPKGLYGLCPAFTSLDKLKAAFGNDAEYLECDVVNTHTKLIHG